MLFNSYFNICKKIPWNFKKIYQGCAHPEMDPRDQQMNWSMMKEDLHFATSGEMKV